MSLAEHARRELELCGQFAEDPAYAQSIVAAVAAFASYGHSGGSAGCALAQLTALLRYETLSPLTADAAEWMDVDGGSLWQSTRRSDAFSRDGGRTYYLLDEPKVDGEQVMHRSAPPRLPALHEGKIAVPNLDGRAADDPDEAGGRQAAAELGYVLREYLGLRTIDGHQWFVWAATPRDPQIQLAPALDEPLVAGEHVMHESAPARNGGSVDAPVVVDL